MLLLSYKFSYMKVCMHALDRSLAQGKRVMISHIAAQSTIQIGMQEILFTAVVRSSEQGLARDHSMCSCPHSSCVCVCVCVCVNR